MNKPILMIPGPVDPPAEVLRRCGMPVFPHYEGDFPAFYHRLTEKMKYVFGLSDGRVQIPGGSGTTAVNMMLASLCTPEDSVLVIHNGSFGDYAQRNLDCIGVPNSAVYAEHGSVVDPEAVREKMHSGNHGFIYATHNESSTAVLTPLRPLGEIAREFDALLLVDGVSSVGGAVIDMDGSGADVVTGASQKCLELPPGLAPVAIGPRAWDYMREMDNRSVPYVLDFMLWEWSLEERGDNHPGLTTSPTTMLYALDWMVERIREEGIEARQERFQAAGRQLKDDLAGFGFTAPVDQSCASPVLTEFIMPKGMSAADFRSYCMTEHNLMLGGGSRSNSDGGIISFRIAHFGRAAESERTELLVRIAREFISSRMT